MYYQETKKKVYVLKLTDKQLAVMRRAVVLYEEKMWADARQEIKESGDKFNGFHSPVDSYECRDLLTVNAVEEDA